jgi:hypothetical protein
MHIPTHFLYYIPLQKLLGLALRFVTVGGADTGGAREILCCSALVFAD